MAAPDAVILCGGLGRRLRAASRGLPKPMVPVRGRPFLEFLVGRLARQGLRRFIFCTGYKAEVIESSLRRRRGLAYLFSPEPSPLGTAGALRLCAPLLSSRTVLVCNGDSYCPLDLTRLLRRHARRGAAATMAVARAPERRDAGSVVLGKGGLVLAFREKSPAGGRGLVNAGVYALSRRLISALPKGRPCSLEREVFPRLAARRRLYGFSAEAPLIDIGTPERLRAFRSSRQ